MTEEKQGRSTILPTRLTEKEAAAELGISLGSLRGLRRRGQIGFVRVLNKIYHYPQHLIDYLDSQTVNVCQPQTTSESPATSKATGSNTSRAASPASDTGRGMTDPAAKSAISQLAKETFKQPKKPLPGGFLKASGPRTRS
ncbi:helix-turn-helix domain-containing protein [Azospirillum soli]|uniref:helix-turn-helix domain-containing protein n=1 Tax=Azospirillum soli TaxID=1304799 RepID=UPI001AEA3023|nr:helix-turn-helix domain-containing protein [Azospirillum soli]MBP2311865.1 hypothetical protein [Azospirillum soli]